MKVQFICKKNECYSFISYTRRSSGLFNSTRFIVDSLRSQGVDAEIIEVNDNNDIDREVRRFKPDLCVIEALWVVPEKFDVLSKLHPNVKWFIHMHSGIPFLALEGIAMDWLIKYAERGVGIIANSEETYAAFNTIMGPSGLYYLPNIYLSKPMPAISKPWEPVLNVGCFGAIRPMKNQLIQALAAIQFAKETEQELVFFVNGSRTETGGDPVLKNLVQLFDQLQNAKLVLKQWMEPEHFLHFLRQMDIGLQVSLTETFNVVCADYVTAGLPVVASDDVKWLSCWSKAKDDSIEDIVKKMHTAMDRRFIINRNQKLLLKNSDHAQCRWFEFVDGQS
jgi:glycosyltransferase involved in cell wall biosynthesis